MLDAHRREKAKANNRSVVPRTVVAARTRKQSDGEVRAHLTSLGLGDEAADKVLVSRKRGRSTTRRSERADGGADGGDGDGDDDGMGEEEGDGRKAGGAKKARARSASRSVAAANAGIPMDREASKARKRSASRAASSMPAAKQGLKDEVQASKIRKAIKQMQARKFEGKQGESDRLIPALKPKHLFTGTAGACAPRRPARVGPAGPQAPGTTTRLALSQRSRARPPTLAPLSHPPHPQPRNRPLRRHRQARLALSDGWGRVLLLKKKKKKSLHTLDI